MPSWLSLEWWVGETNRRKSLSFVGVVGGLASAVEERASFPLKITTSSFHFVREELMMKRTHILVKIIGICDLVGLILLAVVYALRTLEIDRSLKQQEDSRPQ